MNNFRTMSVTALTALVLVLLHVGDVAAQQKTLKEQLVGTWTFVSSSSKNPDGSSVWGRRGGQSVSDWLRIGLTEEAASGAERRGG
jgi:hypothetical protein